MWECVYSWFPVESVCTVQRLNSHSTWESAPFFLHKRWRQMSISWLTVRWALLWTCSFSLRVALSNAVGVTVFSTGPLHVDNLTWIDVAGARFKIISRITLLTERVTASFILATPPSSIHTTSHRRRSDVTARSCPRSGGAEAEQDGCVLGSEELREKV